MYAYYTNRNMGMGKRRLHLEKAKCEAGDSQSVRPGTVYSNNATIKEDG